MSTAVAATFLTPAFLLVRARLACPQCRTGLALEEDSVRCADCGASYPSVDGTVDLRPSSRQHDAETAWTAHWSDGRQQSFSQRFFSFYRKAVFSRSVAHFLNRYFSPSGVFVEAGCGTSETSIRIHKNRGARILVAADIVLPVLNRCHAVMDVRVGADIFRLPFLENSLDGIWNVGVMEHFTHDRIDMIMREFRRALKPGAPLILLWPAVDSIPQKMLRAVERIINLRRSGELFRFHPDEISQLRSSQEGRSVLMRNGFRVLEIDFGFRSLMAFKTLIGAKS